MNFPRREIVERIKKEYPEGTRVELLHMDDPYRTEMVAGLKGTVSSVDDTATGRNMSVTEAMSLHFRLWC